MLQKSGRHLSFSSLIVIFMLGLFLYINSGCGTSPGGTNVPTPPGGMTTLTSVGGTVKAPQGTPATACNPSLYDKLARFFISEAYALLGNTPVPYATVKAYNFYNNNLIATTTTDLNGWYNFNNNIPIGIDVLVVVEQNVTGGSIRLSTVVPNVDVQTTVTGTIDAATTLASEQLALYLGQNLRVIVDDVAALIATAKTSLTGTGEVDFRLGHGSIGSTLGGGLVSNEVTNPVIAATPTPAVMTVAVAKAMIQDMRDCGMTLTRFSSSEVEKQNSNFTNVIQPCLTSLETYFIGSVEPWIEGKLINTLPQTIEAYVNNVLTPYFTETTEAMYTTIVPYLTDTIEAYFNDISNQVMTSGYVLGNYVNVVASGEYQLNTDNSLTTLGATAPGVWIFNLPGSKMMTITLEGTVTLEGSFDHYFVRYKFIVRSLPDPTLDYHGTITAEQFVGTVESFPVQYRISGYLKDAVITDPVTLNIAVTQTGSGAPPNYKYSSVQMAGSFISKELKMNGTISANLFQQADVYPAPSSISFNGSIDTGIIDLYGNMNTSLVRRMGETTYETFLDTLAFQGYITAEAFKFIGTISANIFQNDLNPMPSTLSVNGGIYTDVISLNGSLNYVLAAETVGGKLFFYPTSSTFSGKIGTGVLTFEGDVSASFTKQVVNGNLTNYPFTFTINGKFTPDILGYHGTINMTIASEDIGGTIYQYPSAMSLHGNLTSEVFDFSGDIILSNFGWQLMDESWIWTWWDKMEMQGKFSSDVFSFDGKLTLNYNSSVIEDPLDIDPPYIRTTCESFSLQNADITTECMSMKVLELSTTLKEHEGYPGIYTPMQATITGGEITLPGIKVTGDISLTMVENTVDPYLEYASSLFTFNGTYSDRATPNPSTFTGGWSFIISNAATVNYSPTTEAERIAGYARVKNHLNITASKPGLPTFQLINSTTVDAYEQYSSSIFYGHGLNTLSGNISVDKHSPTKAVTATLVNQLGVTVNLTMNFTNDFLSPVTYASGTIKNSSGTTIGTFSEWNGMLRIDYIDGAFETLL